MHRVQFLLDEGNRVRSIWEILNEVITDQNHRSAVVSRSIVERQWPLQICLEETRWDVPSDDRAHNHNTHAHTDGLVSVYRFISLATEIERQMKKCENESERRKTSETRKRKERRERCSVASSK